MWQGCNLWKLGILKFLTEIRKFKYLVGSEEVSVPPHGYIALPERTVGSRGGGGKGPIVHTLASLK